MRPYVLGIFSFSIIFGAARLGPVSGLVKGDVMEFHRAVFEVL